MINNINELISEIIVRRVEAIYNNIISKDEKYFKSESKIISLIDEIKDKLPDENKNLIYVLEKAVNEQLIIAGEFIYMQAIKDLAQLRKILL
ncbi:hypothetical protein [Clostridium sp. OS1-26]|uniref:hypothetical protein n=1 Tax=Clostridium sp. OS1-26 TaxID=3070681 RepID=UPI0027DEEA6F|nr:hypothetical protein [Clostridium sp. OS1-26]WML35643.1 hypothetical protein RCG18_02505 [Clostridium sp. OS1-26]